MGSKKRTADTLQQIFDYQKCNVEYTSLVNERELSIFEGKSEKEWKGAIENSDLSEDDFKPVNEENRGEAFDRAEKFYKLLKKEKVKNLLIVSHTGFISDLIIILLNLPAHENINFKISFCAINYFNLDKNFKVKDFYMGELKHLTYLN